jgi:hypothetical protein
MMIDDIPEEGFGEGDPAFLGHLMPLAEIGRQLSRGDGCYLDRGSLAGGRTLLCRRRGG